VRATTTITSHLALLFEDFYAHNSMLAARSSMVGRVTGTLR